MNSSADNDDNLVPLVVVIWLDRIQFPYFAIFIIFRTKTKFFNNNDGLFFNLDSLSLCANTTGNNTNRSIIIVDSSSS